MKTRISIALLGVFFFVGCSSDDGPERNEVSIIPDTFLDRDNVPLGTLQVSSREITISVWDHGTIDGDIVSIYVNGEEVIMEQTLQGPGNKFVVNTTLQFEGYNYLLLYAHNEGRISPNTASMAIDDGINVREFILEANLLTNGAVDLIVN